MLSEGGSPTLIPFPRGRGLGLGIENLLYFYKYRLFLQTERQSRSSAFYITIYQFSFVINLYPSDVFFTSK
ncbi:MAG: hypothetical protein EGR74_01110 [Ruminiclostridium sp.]|nr:hypothetical protein [Ruminiclostridium sp.]MBE5718629.1 hypothetical protein [Ruminiclostridium sp.]